MASRLLWGAIWVIGIWLILAYVVLPELWSHYEHNAGLEESPRITRTADGSPGDPLNVASLARVPDPCCAPLLPDERHTAITTPQPNVITL